MSQDQPPKDARALPLAASLSDITRTLDSLRERIVTLSSQGEASGVAERGPRREIRRDLEEIVGIPSSGLDRTELFEVIVDHVARLLHADRVMLFVLEFEGGRLLSKSARGFRREDLGVISVAPGEGVVGRAFLEGRAVLHPEGAEESIRDAFAVRFPVGAAIAVPIRAEAEMVGVLYVGRRAPAMPFTTDEMLLLHLLAERVAASLASQRVAARLDGQVSRLQDLARFSSQAGVARELKDILRQACEVGCRLLDVPVAALARPGESGELMLAAESGMPATVADAWRADPTRGLTGELFSTLHPVVLYDVRGRPGVEEAFLRDLGARACLLVPLRIRDATLGALYLADVNPRTFSPDEVEAAQVLASLVALAMENDRLYSEVRVAFDRAMSAQERLILSEKARALGDMAGGIAHEFNNILAIILGKTQLLMARGPEEPIRDGLGTIEEAAWRAADIVRRLQRYAATNIEETAGSADMSALVHDAIDLTRALWKDEAEARGIQIEVATQMEDPLLVPGNPAALGEVVTNLVLNAIDAMPHGGRLTLRTGRSEGGVEVAVEDTGEGMSPEVRRRIFDPFFSTRSPLRTGLGLSVVHGIVSHHHGRIDVASEEGRGTTVRIWLPALETAAASMAAASPGDAGAVEGPAETVSVLVLEDEQQIRSMLTDALTQAGYSVESAADGLTGLARFQSGRFDVVLTDLSLPECSGLDVARSVKQMRPGTPVVLITGWAHLLDPTRLRDSGVDLMLVKPFRLERVLSVLSDALRLTRPS